MLYQTFKNLDPTTTRSFLYWIQTLILPQQGQCDIGFKNIDPTKIRSIFTYMLNYELELSQLMSLVHNFFSRGHMTIGYLNMFYKYHHLFRFTICFICKNVVFKPANIVHNFCNKMNRDCIYLFCLNTH